MIDIRCGERGRDRAVDYAASVEEDQGTGRAESAQTDLVDAQRAAADRSRLAGLGDAVRRLRQLIDRIGNIDVCTGAQDIGA